MSFPASVNIPTENYVSTVTEDFPTINRRYKLETGIQSRYQRDYLPINCSLTSGAVQDSYLEFVLNSNEIEFIDTKGFSLELKLKLQKNGADIKADDNVTVIDGMAQRLLQMHSVYLNGVPVESNSHFGFCQALDTYTTMRKTSVDSLGRNMFYNDVNMPIYDEVTAAQFGDAAMTSTAKQIKSECRRTLHMVVPINFNLSTSDFYLISGVSMRIRFDLCNAKLLINAPGDADTFSYSIETAKLWAQKVVPEPAALLSLNRSLFNGKSISYIHDRPVVKNFVFPAGHDSLTLENIFGGVIPQMVHVVFIRQAAINGQFNLNGAHLAHCNLSSIRMEINGNTYSSMTTSFPNNIANLFYHTLTNLKCEDNMLNYQSFKSGRTIHSWDLRGTDCADVLNIEKAGSLRINLLLDTPLANNYSVIVIGITSGLIEIFGNRVVKTSYLM